MWHRVCRKERRNIGTATPPGSPTGLQRGQTAAPPAPPPRAGEYAASASEAGPGGKSASRRPVHTRPGVPRCVAIPVSDRRHGGVPSTVLLVTHPRDAPRHRRGTRRGPGWDRAPGPSPGSRRSPGKTGKPGGAGHTCSEVQGQRCRCFQTESPEEEPLPFRTRPAPPRAQAVAGVRPEAGSGLDLPSFASEKPLGCLTGNLISGRDSAVCPRHPGNRPAVSSQWALYVGAHSPLANTPPLRSELGSDRQAELRSRLPGRSNTHGFSKGSRRGACRRVLFCVLM